MHLSLIKFQYCFFKPLIVTILKNISNIALRQKEGRIKFITSFMKPIMKSSESKSSLVLKKQVRWSLKLHFRNMEKTRAKSDSHTNKTEKFNKTYLGNFDSECFDRCFQFLFNICFVQSSRSLWYFSLVYSNCLHLQAH